MKHPTQISLELMRCDRQAAGTVARMLDEFADDIDAGHNNDSYEGDKQIQDAIGKMRNQARSIRAICDTGPRAGRT